MKYLVTTVAWFSFLCSSKDCSAGKKNFVGGEQSLFKLVSVPTHSQNLLLYSNQILCWNNICLSMCRRVGARASWLGSNFATPLILKTILHWPGGVCVWLVRLTARLSYIQSYLHCWAHTLHNYNMRNFSVLLSTGEMHDRVVYNMNILAFDL